MSSFVYESHRAYSGLGDDSVSSGRKSARRPISAKVTGGSCTRRPSRPNSANRMVPSSHRIPSASRLTSQSMLLHRLKPNKIHMDKEALYEENLAFKLEINELRQENGLLKTKMRQLERELVRLLEDSEGKSRQGYLQVMGKTAKVRGLRKKVQILNQELVSREEENDDLRRDILFTQKSELEAQVQTYAEECSRLKEYIAELEDDRERLRKAEQLHSEQEKAFFALEQENDDLRRSLARYQKDSSRYRRFSQRDKRRASASKAEVANLKLEIQRLRAFAQSESPAKRSNKPESPSPVPKSVQVTQAEIKRELGYEYSVAETLQRLQHFSSDVRQTLPEIFAEALGKEGTTSVDTVFIALRKKGFYWEKEEAKLLLTHVHQPGDCPIEELLSFLARKSLKSPVKTMPPSLPVAVQFASPAKVRKVQFADVRLLLRHISFRLQLQHLPKTKLMSLVIGSNPDRFRTLQVPQLQEILSTPPFSVTDADSARLLARFLVETENFEQEVVEESIQTMKKSVGDIVEKLNRSLEAWECFSPEQEEAFDQHIGALLNRNKVTFKAACKGYDAEKSGVISYSDFKEVLEGMEIELDDQELHYLQLLFYSSLNELDLVPYKQLLQAYTQGGGVGSSQESLQPSEAESRATIQKYLQLISNALVSKKATVRKAFKATEGYVSPQQFYDAYRSLNLPHINQESLGMLLDALQGDEYRSDYSVSISFLEEVFAHYGVEPESEYAQKQISNLESPIGSKREQMSSEDISRKSNTSERASLSEQSPFFTAAKSRKEVPTSSEGKQWDISESEEADYQEDDFESGSARSV